MKNDTYNIEVTEFLNSLNHPLRNEIEYNLLVWRENDRAIATVKSLADIEMNEAKLMELIKSWIKAAS